MKKNKMVIFLLLVGIMSIFYSCAARREKIEKAGLLKEHELKKFEICNSNHGEAVQFWWKAGNGEIIVTLLRVGQCRFIIDEEKEVPTVTFIFPESLLNMPDGENPDLILDRSHYIEDYASTCIIRLSSKMLAKGEYLSER